MDEMKKGKLKRNCEISTDRSMTIIVNLLLRKEKTSMTFGRRKMALSQTVRLHSVKNNL